MLFTLLLGAAESLWSVHIDTPQSPAAFERAQAAWAGWLKTARDKQHLAQPHINEISVGGMLFSLSPLGSPSLTLSAADRRTLDLLDGACDKEVQSHHNEQWELDTDFTFIATAQPSAVARWHSETIRAPRIADYNEAATAFHQAVARSDQVSIVFFWTRYGSAQSHWLCQAATAADLALCDPKRTLTPALYQLWQGVLVDSSAVDARFRPDLTTLPVAADWR